MSVKDIEAAIERLTPRERAELAAWMQEHLAEVWDRQLAEDLEAGRLDRLLNEVEKEHRSGLAKPL